MVSVDTHLKMIMFKSYLYFSHLGVLHFGERKGYPANAVFIVDRSSKVRYNSVLEPTVAHSPDSILRIVSKLQATDDGDHLVMSGELLQKTLIENTFSGIKEYYKYTFGGIFSRDSNPAHLKHLNGQNTDNGQSKSVSSEKKPGSSDAETVPVAKHDRSSDATAVQSANDKPHSVNSVSTGSLNAPKGKYDGSSDAAAIQ